MAFSKQDLQKALPPTASKLVITDSMVNYLNKVTDPIVAENIRDNFVSYSTVLMEGAYKSEDYVNAVAYVTYKMMGLSNKDAYNNTFPDRYQALLARGATEKDMSAYHASYHKNKLVNAIMSQALIPMWLVNQDIYQKAINTQAELMLTSQSDLVRTQAANSLLTHLAKPKDAVPAVAIQINQNSGMQELQGMLAELVDQQIINIQNGVPTQAVAAQKLVGGSNGSN